MAILQQMLMLLSIGYCYYRGSKAAYMEVPKLTNVISKAPNVGYNHLT